MSSDVTDFRMGGSMPLDFWELLQGSGTSDTHVWCRVMGYVPSDWEDPGRFIPQGGTWAGKDAAEEVCDRQADLSASGHGNEVSSTGEGGDVRPLPPEYRCPLYCHLADTGAISGGGETAGGADVDGMVL